MPVLGWELVYTNGSVVTSQDTSWEDALGTRVQVMVLHHEPPYMTLQYGWDPYALPGHRSVKIGETIPDADFYALVDATLTRLGRR